MTKAGIDRGSYRILERLQGISEGWMGTCLGLGVGVSAGLGWVGLN